MKWVLGKTKILYNRYNIVNLNRCLEISTEEKKKQICNF